MKPTRILASATLLVSSIALITAAGISVGDEPGVVRMGDHSPSANFAASPTPDTGMSGVATMDGGPADPTAGMYPQPAPYAPYFERSYGATQQIPHSAYQPAQPFGPIMMFETNIGDGLGYEQSYQRLNARIPYHIIPNTNVLIGDISASVTNYSDPLGNAGLIYRNYDSARNRIFGVNGYFDYDQGYGAGDWYQAGAGFESLGKYLDFRLNGYFAVGNDSQLLSTSTSNNLALVGNGAFKVRTNNYENAYSGIQAETGGPLPVLGEYGINMYAGAYFLHNDFGKDATGFQARWEALVTESLRVNTYLTTDRTFGMNSWVSLQYDLPNYKNRRVLRRSTVRERLQDPVVRDNRIHVHRDTQFVYNPVINTATGVGYKLLYVDPNRTTAGAGTFENPYSTLAAADIANNDTFDIIRVVPRADDTNTNLTVNGGMTLFDDQTLLSSLTSLTLAPNCVIPADTGLTTNLGPLISNPTMLAGGSVVHLANNDSIFGFRIDGANADGTVVGNGIANALPITGLNLQNNTFTNYIIGAELTDLSGRVIVANNTFTGRAATGAIRSDYGMRMSVAGGSNADLLLFNNSATTNRVAGLSVTAQAGSTLNADSPLGLPDPTTLTANEVLASANTGIANNVLTGNGNGIEVLGNAGSTINATIENNQAIRSTNNGLLARTDAGIFNLASLRNNTFTGNYDANLTPTTSENGAFLHYRNGGVFFAQSEDVNEDKNLNGFLDPGEDLNGNGALNVANGTLDAGEDLNGNGILDQGIVSNTFQNNVGVGLCIFGETAGTGNFTIGGPATNLGNRAINNGDAGMAMDFNGTAIAGVDSMFNTITDNAFARTYTTRVQASFAMTGNTHNTAAALTNLSATGDITQFNWNLDLPAGTQDWEFDTTQQLINPVGTRFAPTPGTDLTTGLNLVNGFFVSPGNYSNALQNGLDQQQLLTLGFVNDAAGVAGFDQNEAFGWILDSDPRDPIGIEDTRPDDVVIANQLAGTSATVTFRDDFTGNGVQSLRTLSGTMAQSATDPQGVELQFDQSFSAPIFDTAVSRRGDGVRVNAADNSRITHFNSINDTMSRNKGDGLSIVASDNSRVDALTIQGGTMDQNQGRGINIEAHDTAVITANSTIGGYDTRTLGQNIISGTSYTEGNRIRRNGSDGIRILAGNGGTVNGNLINNTIEENLGDGASLVIDNGGTLNFGNLANNEVISRNRIRANNGAGLRLTSNVSPTSVGMLNALIQGNTISSNAGGGVVGVMSGVNNSPPNPPAVNPNNTINLTMNDSAYVDLTPAQNKNVISNNGDVGVGVNVTGNGIANVTINNLSVTGTFDGADPLRNGDGLALTRDDASLLLATVTNSSFTSNAGDGMDVNAQGNDRFDVNQPMSGTANMVTVLNSIFNNNGGNGAQFGLHGDATLVGDISGSTFNSNGLNGTLLQSTENSSFGDPTDGLPPGRRSLFDGNTFNDNGVDGVQVVATENSRVLVEITSNRVPGSSAAHAAANTNGDTSISRNGRDGVRITTTGGRSDILITSGTGQTTIDGNGTTTGGNGIRWDASGDSQASVRVTKTIITNSIAGLTEDTATNGNGVLDPGEDLNGNGTLDPGEDTNANADVDVVDGDGIQANFTGNTDATLIVGGVSEGNVIQSNDDDGIAITATGRTENRTTWFITPGAAVTPVDLTSISDIGPVQKPTPIISIVGNTIGGQNNGIAAGNRGDGISINTLGGTDIGTLPANVDSTISIPPSFADVFVSDNFGAIETGAIPQITISDNVITQNTRRGANVLLTGAGGTRNREFGQSEFDPIRITFTGNTISSNGEEGIYYRADSDMTQNRFVYLPNFPIVGPPANDNQNFSPFRPEFFALNNGSINGNTSYSTQYLNLRTVQNSYLTVTDNIIQYNGTGGVTGEGLFIKVGTGSYVAADIQDNVFGGNLEEDFRTSSFVSSSQTFNSVDRSGDGTFDFVYLDDTAQLDLRFQNNEGNQIDAFSGGDDELLAESIGATYTNNDPLKFNNSLGGRQTDLFQVDNGPFLNNPNNSFINFGLTQNIQGAFTTGGYNLRAAADPLFPNIGFAPFLP